jgi:hypothetical protein
MNTPPPSTLTPAPRAESEELLLPLRQSRDGKASCLQFVPNQIGKLLSRLDLRRSGRGRSNRRMLGAAVCDDCSGVHRTKTSSSRNRSPPIPDQGSQTLPWLGCWWRLVWGGV